MIGLGWSELLMLLFILLACLLGSALVGGLFYWLHLRVQRLEERLAAQEQDSQGGEP